MLINNLPEIYLFCSLLGLLSWLCKASSIGICLAFMVSASALLIGLGGLAWSGTGVILVTISLLAISFRFGLLILSGICAEVSEANIPVAPLLLGALVRSTPLAGLTILAIFLSALYGRLEVSTLYSQSGGVVSCDQRGLLLCGGSDALDDDIKGAIHRIRQKIEDKSSEQVNSAISGKGGNQPDFANLGTETLTVQLLVVLFDSEQPAVPQNVSEFIPTLGSPRECYFYQWAYQFSDCLLEATKDSLNASYGTMRQALRSHTQSELRSRLTSSNRSMDYPSRFETDQIVLDLTRAISNELDSFEEKLNVQIDNLFLFFQLLQLLWFFLLIGAFVKGFLYIFARLIFSSDANAPILRIGTKRDIEGTSIKAMDITQETNGCTFAVSTEQQIWFLDEGEGMRLMRKGVPSWPSPFELPFVRLRHGLLFMHRYSSSDGFLETAGRASHASRFVLVNIDKGRRLSIRLEHLVGFTQGVHLRRHWSFSLATFLSRQFKYYCAEGDGMLLLRADGGTVTVHPDSKMRGSDPLDFIAFDFDGGFQLDARNDIWSSYLHGVSISPVDGTLAVEQAPTRPSTSGRMALGNLFRFLLPF